MVVKTIASSLIKLYKPNYVNDNDIDEKILLKAYQTTVYQRKLDEMEKIFDLNSFYEECVKDTELTQFRLKKLLHYDKKTGLFTRLTKASNSKIGQNAGCLTVGGYIRISINNKQYAAHILAWLYVTGEYPVYIIDHKDGVRHNNKWKNLRLATASQNVQNRSICKNNKSGYKGVHYYPKNKKYIAQITINYVPKYLGSFDTAEEAHKAYCKRALQEFGEYAKYG